MKFIRYFQNKINIRYLIVGVLIILVQSEILAQGCCSGGSANPISGGASTGVLQKNQIESMSRHRLTNVCCDSQI